MDSGTGVPMKVVSEGTLLKFSGLLLSFTDSQNSSYLYVNKSSAESSKLRSSGCSHLYIPSNSYTAIHHTHHCLFVFYYCFIQYMSLYHRVVL